MVRKTLLVLAGSLLVAGCVVPPPAAVAPEEAKAVRAAKKPEPSPSASPDAQVYTGLVLGLDGEPAADVQVFGYPADAELVSIGKLISDQGGSVISNNGGSLVANNGSKWRILQEQGLATRTDAEGRFMIKHPAGKPLNIEAVLEATVKAIELDVPADRTELTLRLERTGAIAGKVTAPDAPGVTDFEGVDVFIPGTGYLAKAAKDGSYTIPNVPVGSFGLVAKKEGLGRGSAQGVKVASVATTTAPDLALSLVKPMVTAVSPANGGPGTTVTIRGENFGASSGATFQVTFGGTIASEPKRQDDGTITAVVPAGANANDVVVSVSGVPGAPASFQVIKAIALTDPRRDVVLGTPQAYAIGATDTLGKPVPSPTVSWTAEGTAFEVSASGLVTPKALGEGTLRASAGTIAAALAVEVVESLPTVSDAAGSGAQGFDNGNRTSATFNFPHDVALDADGNLYVSDWGNHAVRKVAIDGAVSTLAGNGSPGSAVGTGTAAQFKAPIGVTVGPSGFVHLADTGNARMCRIGSGGEVLAIVQGMDVHGVVLDAAGNWYLTDYAGHRVHKLTPQGTLTVVAGSGSAGGADGKGTAAQFHGPRDLAVDATGNLYVTEWDGHRVRKIAPDGTVTTLGGNGSPGNADGTAAEARFNRPASIVVDARGNVYFADRENHRIRKITPSGQVKTFAGTGASGHGNGSGAQALFAGPNGLGIDKDGNLYVADTGNHRIRKIAF